MGGRSRLVTVVGAALYLLGIGFLVGIATERIYFDQRRAAVIEQYESALRRWQGYRMQLEKRAAAPGLPPARSPAPGVVSTAR